MTAIDVDSQLAIATGLPTRATGWFFGERRLLAAILLVAVGIRLAWTLIAAPAPESDFLTFFQTAQLIAQGVWWPDAYGWAWQGPGYPLLIAPLTLLGAASLPAIQATNIALGVITVWLLYRLTSTLLGRRAGLIAAALGAAYPGLWLWAPIVSAENLSAPIFLSIATLLLERSAVWRLPLLGLLTGGLIFVRPSALFFVVVVVLSVIWLAQPQRRIRSVASVLIGLSIALGTIAIPNLRAGGSALPVGASGWQPWLVHNERATGEWFPAQDRDDYPYHGMENNPSLAGIVRSAQVKMAVQYALLNPSQVLPGIIHRHVRNWQQDDAGLFWTVRRPESLAYAPNVDAALQGVVSRAYLAIAALAFLAVWTMASRLTLVIVALLPIAYLVAPAVIAEGNSRYHVNALPFLIVLAAASFAGRTKLRELLLPLGTLALAVAVPPGPPVVPWVILAIFAVTGARLTLEGVRMLRATFADRSKRSRLAWGFGAAVIGIQIFTALALFSARQAVVDWSIVRPELWRPYGAGATADRVVLKPSAVSVDLRKVSYPDAAVVPAHSSEPRARAGLVRSFPNLEPGAHYVLYLQVHRPTQGQDQVLVVANGRVVWEWAPSLPDTDGWHDVIVPWVADTPFLSLQVERIRGAVGPAPEVLVRSAHVYPKY